MRRRLAVLAAVPLVLTFLASPFDASAQWYRRYKRVDVDNAIRRAENTSNEFKKVFDRQLDQSVLNDSEREDKLNEKAKDLENKLDALRREFDSHPNWWEARGQAEDALLYAKGINNSVRARRYSDKCERMWVSLRYDLNRVARYFNLPQLPR